MGIGIMDKRYQKPTLAGIIILSVWSLILIAMIAEIIMWILGIMAASTIYVLIAFTLLAFLGSVVAIRLAMAKKIRTAEDERIRKLDAFARGNAWSVSMAIVTALYILTIFKVIALDVNLIVFVLFAVMGWSWILFRAYYYFKGDVE